MADCTTMSLEVKLGRDWTFNSRLYVHPQVLVGWVSGAQPTALDSDGGLRLRTHPTARTSDMHGCHHLSKPTRPGRP